MVSDVSPSPAEGGGTRMLWEQSSRLVARGHDVRVVCRAGSDGDASTAERQGVRIRRFPIDRRTARGFILSSVLGARRAVTLELKDHGADVLHMHQPLAGYGVLTSAAVRGLPRLYSFHSSAPLEYRSRRGMTVRHRGGFTGWLGLAALWGVERACVRRATTIHALSDYSSELLWKLYRVPRDRVVKIPGGADTAWFRPAEDRAAVRKALDLPAAGPVLLTVRNLEARMGLDLLIRAMAILKRDMPEALLLIGGGGSGGAVPRGGAPGSRGPRAPPRSVPPPRRGPLYVGPHDRRARGRADSTCQAARCASTPAGNVFGVRGRDPAKLAPLSRLALPTVLTLSKLGRRGAADRPRAPALLPDRIPAPLQPCAGEHGTSRPVPLRAGPPRLAPHPLDVRWTSPGRRVRRQPSPPSRSSTRDGRGPRRS